MHDGLADAIEAIEEKVGVDDSADTSSHDFKIRALEEQTGDLQDQIDNIDPTVEIDDVTGLQDALDGKASLAHTHVISDVTNLQASLDGKSNVGHSHAISDVSGLQTALDGKQDESENLDLWAQVSPNDYSTTEEVNGSLATKANVSHTHTSADVTDFTSAARATVSAGSGLLYALGEFSLNVGNANAWTAPQSFNFLNIYQSVTATELLTNGTFTGSASGWSLATGWAYNGNQVEHSSNGSGVLAPSPAFTPVVGELYQLQFTLKPISGTTGVVTPLVAGVNLGTITAPGTNTTYKFLFRASTTANLNFAPSTTARFAVDDVSIKLVTGYGSLANSTPAEANSQQFSPPLLFEGQGWKTTATAGSQSVKFMAYLLPVQGSSNPSGRLHFQSSINGGAWQQRFFIDSSGTIGLPALTTNRPLKIDANSLVVASQINLASGAEVTNVLLTGNGGTGRDSWSDGAIPYSDMSLSTSTLWFDADDFYRYNALRRYGFGIGQSSTGSIDAKVVISPSAACEGSPADCDTYVEQSPCEFAGCGWTTVGNCNTYTDETACEAVTGCSWTEGEDCSNFDENQAGCEAADGCTWNLYDCHEFDENEGDCTGHGGCTWETDDCSDFNGNQGACQSQAGCTYPGTAGDCADFNANMSACNSTSGCTYPGNTGSCSDFDGDEGACGATSGCTQNYYDCSQHAGDQGGCEGAGMGCTWNDPNCEGPGNFTNCTGNYDDGSCTGNYDDGSCTGEYGINSCTGTYGTPDCTGTYGSSCDEDPYCEGSPSECDSYGNEGDCTAVGCEWDFEDALHPMGTVNLSGQDIRSDDSTGTRIGTAPSQMLGFFGASPVSQPSSVADVSGGATVDTQAREAINDLLTRLRELGLIAS